MEQQIASIAISLAALSLCGSAHAKEKEHEIVKTVVMDGKTYTVTHRGKWAKVKLHSRVFVMGGPKQVRNSVRAAEIATNCGVEGYTDRNVFVDVLLDCSITAEPPSPDTKVTVESRKSP